MEDRAKAIIDAYKAGLSQGKIANLCGVNQTTVCRILQKHKITTRKPVNMHENAASRVDEALKQSIIDAYKDGSTTREIGALCGINYGTVAGYLRAWGIPMRPSHCPLGQTSKTIGKPLGKILRKTQKKTISETDKSTMIQMYENGSSTFDVGRKFNMNRSTARKYLRKWGVELRQHKVSPEKKKQLIEKYKTGKAISDLAQEYRVDRKTVRNIIRDNLSNNIAKLEAKIRELHLTR